MRRRRPTPTKLLITGPARSGTHYLAQLLSNARIDATHEATRISNTEFRDFAAGSVDVNSELGFRIGNAVEWSEASKTVGVAVRHPQQVVASIVGREMWDEEWGGHRLYECPILGFGSAIDRSLAYWIEINWAIEKQANTIRIPIAHPLPALTELLETAQVDYSSDRLSRAIESTATDIGHRSDKPPVEYDWQDHDPWLRETAEKLFDRLST